MTKDKAILIDSSNLSIKVVVSQGGGSDVIHQSLPRQFDRDRQHPCPSTK